MNLEPGSVLRFMMWPFQIRGSEWKMAGYSMFWGFDVFRCDREGGKNG